MGKAYLSQQMCDARDFTDLMYATYVIPISQYLTI